MAINQFPSMSFGTTPSQVLGAIFHAPLKLNDLQTNKDGSKTAIYDWANAAKLGFAPTVEATSKITPTSTLMSLGIRMPCGNFTDSEALELYNANSISQWTVTLSIRGGPSELTAQGLSDLKTMIASAAGLVLFNGSTGAFESQSPVLNALLRGNPNFK